jgi:hypothetical protein
VDSSEGTYGWAADDPRWTDILAGGKGRLEPSPAPRFGESDVTAEPAPPAETPAATRPLDLPPWPPTPQSSAPTDAARGPLSGSAAPWPPAPSGAGLPADGLTASRAAEPDEAPWIPPDTGLAASGARPWTEPAPTPWEPTPWRPPAWPSTTAASAPWPTPPETAEDLFGPPLAISAQPAPAAQPVGHGSAAASVPFTIHTQFPTPGLRTGYGLSTAALPAGAGAGAGEAALPARSARLSTRLERQVRARTRRRADDEFRQAGRAELFSDDARYKVLLWLTAAWYLPVAVVYLGWAVIVGGDHSVFAGVVWLAAGAALSLGVVSLLRWASVGWRAITLSLAAAVIGGGVVTIAHTLAN